MKKLLLISILIAGLLLAAYYLNGGQQGIVTWLVPWPDQATASQELIESSEGEITFASSTPFDLDVLLQGREASLPTTGQGTLLMPPEAAKGPVPAVILLHGSGGISPGREMEHGEMLAKQGYAAFVLDYYTPRGATLDKAYMLRVLSVTEFDAVADAYGALSILRTHPKIDPSNIAVAGFSYGGMAARFAMDTRIKQALIGDAPGFTSHIDFYGPCFQQLNSNDLTGGPLLTLRGTEDSSNELPACLRREAELEALGTTVEAHVFQGAGHAWDNHTPRAMKEDAPYLSGCTMTYDERGGSSIDGQAVIELPLDSRREVRIANRVASSGPASDCLDYGYVIGRDDKTRARADELMLDFLQRTLR